MHEIEQAQKRYGFLVDFYDGPNDPLYKRLILELAWHDSYIKRDGTHIMFESQRRMAKLFRPEPPSKYADAHNEPKPDYTKDTGYDTTLSDIQKMYEVLLSFYDMGYKGRQYHASAGAGAKAGLEDKLIGNN